MTEVDAVLPEGIAASKMPNKTSIDANQQQQQQHDEEDVTSATELSPKATVTVKTAVVDIDAAAQLKLQNLDNDNSSNPCDSGGDGDVAVGAVTLKSNNNEENSKHNNSSTEAANSDGKPIESMDVDDDDEEDDDDSEEDAEDDSQLTTSSSAENKTETPVTGGEDDDEHTNGGGGGGDIGEETELDSASQSVTPLSHSRDNDICEVGQTKSGDDDSQLVTDSEQSASAAAAEKTSALNEPGDDSQASTSDSDVDEDEDSRPPSKSPSKQNAAAVEDSQDSSAASNGALAVPVVAAKVHVASNGKEASKNDEADDEELMDSTETATKPSVSSASVLAAEPQQQLQQRENGVANETDAKAAGDDAAGIVNLDDSDEEMMDAPPTQKEIQINEISIDPIAAKPTVPVATMSPKAAPLPPLLATVKSERSNESDDAVIIGSDSESENNEPPPAITIKKIMPVSTPNRMPAPAPAVTADDDDDDDDCVVIEDDDPPTPYDTNKRKVNDSNDDLPPHKRQRGLTPVAGTGGLTIKDARSLMPQDATAVTPKKEVGGGNIYPVTITTSTPVSINTAQGPPKLVPMSNNAAAVAANNALAAATLSFAGLPGMTNNANLLPGLTDDMYVLEAPSFIVPYIYEKPPTDNIKDVIKEIESKYALSAEDLAEAIKPDEFDMMTEQNKAEKPSTGGKKKKKRDDNDDSWSEQSDEDDDDDEEDSDSGVRTKVLIKEASDDLVALKGAIKPAAAVTQSGAVNNANIKPGQENYFESPLGKFFMDIGVGLVQEYVQADLLRLQKRKMRKSLSRDPKDFELAISALSGNLQASKTKNAPFKFTLKRCEFCSFKSESALAMANHYETPHMNGFLYKCNFCTFEIRNATEIVYHMEAVHNIKARLIKPLPYHQCPNCGFEDNGKAKLARHQPVCAKKFRPELNLAPPTDWEAPAKIPRIKPRHGLVGTATAYQAMAAQAAAQKAALASIQAQQVQAAQARNLQAAQLAAQNAAKLRARAPINPAPKPVPNPPSLLRGPTPPVRNPVSTNVVLPNNYHVAAGQLVQQAAKKPITGQPSISITPLPRQNAAASGGAGGSPSTSKLPPAGIKPGQSPSSGSKAQFVICEICDGYIKDLEQLRNHMQWMHKVKIHPKMIYNRPPLNCQKCQFRFFTDQGLERHLLGSHGLVTSSMQEAANKGKDAGRCPVCGRMYQWKLLNHVSRDHHMTLKPAHLSYKCTVCTATFGMYKQFETHVYTAHSTVAKKAMETKKGQQQQQGSVGGSSSTSAGRNSLSANESLLKPLKINDEITIIPQPPTSKPRITNMESHVID